MITDNIKNNLHVNDTLIYCEPWSDVSYHIDDLINDRAKITLGRTYTELEQQKIGFNDMWFQDVKNWLEKPDNEVLGGLVRLFSENQNVITIKLDNYKIFENNSIGFKGIALAGEVVVKENTGHSEKGGHYYVQED